MTMTVGSWLETGLVITMEGLPLWHGLAVVPFWSTFGGGRNQFCMPSAGSLGDSSQQVGGRDQGLQWADR